MLVKNKTRHIAGKSIACFTFCSFFLLQETTGPVASHTESKPTSDSNSTAVSSNTPSFLSNYAGGCDSEQSSPEDTPNSQGTTESASCVEVAELSNQINVKLCPEEKTSRHPPISGTAEERCQQALKHIAEVGKPDFIACWLAHRARNILVGPCSMKFLNRRVD